MAQQNNHNDSAARRSWRRFLQFRLRTLEMTYADGMLHGPARAWRPDGQLEYEGEYVGDERCGWWTLYDAQGQQSAQGKYECGRREGVWQAWDAEGASLPPQHYVQGRLVHVDEQLLAALKQSLYSRKFSERAKALWVLGSLGHFGVPILEEASHSGDPPLRALTLTELAKHPSWAEANVPRLAAALEENSRPLHKAVMLALANIGPAAKEAAPKLERMRNDPDAMFRACVLGTLASMVDHRDVAEELVLAINHLHTTSSQQFDEALGYVGRLAHDSVIQIMGSNRAEVRAAAVVTLGALNEKSRYPSQNALQTLAEAVRDKAPLVRLNACQALGRIGPAAAFAEPFLQAAEKDADPQVAAAAQGAVQSVRGQGFSGGFGGTGFF